MESNIINRIHTHLVSEMDVSSIGANAVEQFTELQLDIDEVDGELYSCLQLPECTDGGQS